MKRERWRDNPRLIKKIREVAQSSAVLLPYRQTNILISRVKEKLPLPCRLFFSSEKVREKVGKKGEKILNEIFPASLLFHLDNEYLTLASDPMIKKIFASEEEIFFSEWQEEKDWEASLWIEGERKKVRPFTILKMGNDSLLLEKKGEVGILEVEKALGEKVKLSPELFFSVLIVCTGNTCRSPMAKGILEKLLSGRNVFVYSAGVSSSKNLPPSDYAQRFVARLGGDISRHRSQPLTPEMIEDADLILVMEKWHLLKIKEIKPEAENKVFMLSSYPEKEGKDISDPIGLPYESFFEIGHEIERYLEKVAQEIKERL